MPAYNAERTLERTFFDVPQHLRHQVLLVDDCSTDRTVQVARSLGLEVIQHERNRGYGANQKTCYRAALERHASVVVMLHPDFQYDARVVEIMAELIYLGNVDFVLGNRIRTRAEALSGGMPKWKYFLNRMSTFAENLILGQTIGDFHSGLRAYSRDMLTKIPFDKNSDDFAFDQEMIAQAVALRFRIGDIPVPVRYFEEASSINLRRSIRYGIGGLSAIAALKLHNLGIRHDERFIANQSSCGLGAQPDRV
jgi:glycosyltransferase involved in cell wall biosynthesis